MQNEQEIIRQLKDADERAFKLIFEAYVKKVNRFIFNYVKNKTEASDITQNIFVKLWEKKGNIEIDKPFQAYLFSISYTTVMDYFRKCKFETDFTVSEGLYNETLSADGCTDDLLIYNQTASIYKKALEILPDRRKEIFMLSRHEGLSNKEIADRLGLSVKTVENQMTSALASLKKSLHNSGLMGLMFFFI